MLTGKAAGQPVESWNDAPGKRESRVEEKEDGQGEKMRTAFSAFILPSALKKDSLGAAVVRSGGRSRARRSRAK